MAPSHHHLNLVLQKTTSGINSQYIAWHRQDQLLLSWIISFLTEGVHAQVVGLFTSQEVWTHLAATYARHSKAQIMQLRLQLYQMKKGSDKMPDYLLKEKIIADQLAMASKPIDDDELIHDDELIPYILGGWDQNMVHLSPLSLHVTRTLGFQISKASS